MSNFTTRVLDAIAVVAFWAIFGIAPIYIGHKIGLGEWAFIWPFILIIAMILWVRLEEKLRDRQNKKDKKKNEELDQKIDKFRASAEWRLSSLAPCVVILDSGSLIKISGATAEYAECGGEAFARSWGWNFPDLTDHDDYYWGFVEGLRKMRALWNVAFWGRISMAFEVVVPECVLRKIMVLCNGENEDEAKNAKMARGFLEDKLKEKKVKIYSSSEQSQHPYEEELIECITKLLHGDKKVIFLCEDQDLRIRAIVKIEKEGFDAGDCVFTMSDIEKGI